MDDAFHEAGHAVAVVLRPLAGRLALASVALDRKESGEMPGALGYVLLHRKIPSVTAAGVDWPAAKDTLVYMHAGGEAEAIHRGDRLSGAGADYDAAHDLAMAAMRSETEELILRSGLPADQIVSKCTALVIGLLEETRLDAAALLKENWSSVEAVAHELLECGELSGAEVEELVLTCASTDARN